jgi:hypothetical protein
MCRSRPRRRIIGAYARQPAGDDERQKTRRAAAAEILQQRNIALVMRGDAHGHEFQSSASVDKPVA